MYGIYVFGQETKNKILVRRHNIIKNNLLYHSQSLCVLRRNQLSSLQDVLQALLEKQKKEVRETETLIQELSETSDGQTDIIKEAKKSNASEIALSIYSGFNYGFISRSQGCASGLEGGFQNGEG